MPVFYIILSVIVGLTLIGGIFYISFMMESMKQRQALLKRKAAERVQKFQRFLECFQPGVLPKEIKLVLIDETIFNLRTMAKLDSADAKTQRMLEEAIAQHKDITQSKNKAPVVPQVKSLQEAKEVQQQFKNLFRLLSYIGKTRKIHTNVINKNLKILQSLFVDTSVSVHKNIAKAAAQQNKTKLELYHLNQAIGEYARLDSKKFADKIKQLKQQTIAIEQKMKAVKAEQPAQQEQQQETLKKKDRGLDRMFDEKAAMSAKRNMK